MCSCKYAKPEEFSDLKVWLALVTRKHLYPCRNVMKNDCSTCQYEQFCVCDGVSYKGVEFIALGPVEYTNLGYTNSPTTCRSVSTGAGHLQWRFIEGLPHEGFLLIQKIVRKAGQNMFKIGDRIYWQPFDNYTVEIDDSEWHMCWPEIGREYIGNGVYRKVTIERTKK